MNSEKGLTNENWDEIQKYIEALKQSRIIKNFEGNHEIAHDSLASKIFEKFTGEERAINKQVKFIKEEYDRFIESNKKRSLSVEELKDIEKYRTQITRSLNPEQIEFINRSYKKITQEKIRKNVIYSVVTILLVAFISQLIYSNIERKKNNDILVIHKNSLIKSQEALNKEVIAKQGLLIKSEELRRLAINERNKAEQERNKAEQERNKAQQEKYATELAAIAWQKASENPTVSLKFITKAGQLTKNKLVSIMSYDYFNNYIFYEKDIIDNTDFVSPVSSVDISSDNNIIIGYRDGSLKIFKRNGEIIKKYNHHIGEITSVNSDGNYILTSSIDRKVKLINGTSSRVTTEIHNSKNDEVGEYVSTTSFLKTDDKDFYIITGSNKGYLKIWNNNEELFHLQAHNRSIHTIDLFFHSDDSLYALTASLDGTAKLWNINSLTHNALPKFTYGSSDATHENIDSEHAHYAKFLNNDDNLYIVTGSCDANIRILNLKDGKINKILQSHSDEITSIDISTDGNYIISGSRDKSCILWDASTGKKIATLVGHKKSITAVKFSYNGTFVATGSEDGSTKIWDITQFLNKNKFVAQQEVDGRHTHIISSNGKYYLSKHELLDLSNLKTFNISNHIGPSEAISLSNDGKFIISTEGNNAFLSDTSDAKIITYRGHTNKINSIIFSPDNKNVLTASNDSTAILWNINRQEPFRVLNKSKNFHLGKISAIAFSKDEQSKLIATGSSDKTVRLWDLNGTCIRTFKGHYKTVNTLTFSNNSKYLLTGSADKTVNLYKINGYLLKSFYGHTDEITSVAFSNDDNFIITGSSDKTVRLWDLNGNLIHLFDGHKSTIKEVKFTYDENFIAVLTSDDVVTFYQSPIQYEKISKTQNLASLGPKDYLDVGIDPNIQDLMSSNNPEELLQSANYMLQKAENTFKNDLQKEYAYKAEVLFKKSLKELPSINAKIGIEKARKIQGYEYNFENLISSNNPLHLIKYGDFFYDHAIKANNINIVNDYMTKAKKLYEKCYNIKILPEVIGGLVDVYEFFKLPYSIPKMTRSVNYNDLHIYSDYFLEKKIITDDIIKRNLYEQISLDLLAMHYMQDSEDDWPGNLANSYANLSFQQLKVNNFKAAQTSINKALASSEKSTVEVLAKEAHVLLLNNHFEDAKIRYTNLMYMPAKVESDSIYKITFLYDLYILEQANIIHPNIRKIREILLFGENNKEFNQLIATEKIENLTKEYYFLTEWADRIPDYIEKLYICEKALAILEKVYQLKHEQDLTVRKELSIAYGKVAFYRIFNLQAKEAIDASEKGLELDSSQEWIYTNLALGYLFSNQYSKAENLYLTLKDKKIKEKSSISRTFKDAFLDDFYKLKLAGITSKDTQKIIELLHKK